MMALAVGLTSACGSSAEIEPAPAAELRFLALGDSYTIGESVDATHRWPVQLAELLRNEAVEVAPPSMVAQTGWTTAELAAGIDAADPQGEFGLVSLLIGVNNQYRGLDAEEYRLEFRQLLERAIAFAGGRPDRVIILSIPDWGVTPFAEGEDRERIAREIDEFNLINLEETQRANARYVDVTPISREAATDPSLVADDGLHPSGEMYAAWAELALPEALAAIGER